MKEKRISRRKKEANKVKIEPISEDEIHSGKKFSFSITDDISLRGIKIMTETFFPIDTLLKIELSLAKTKKIITMTGKVRWVKKLDDRLNEVGIEMVGTTKDNIKILFEHLYKYENESY